MTGYEFGDLVLVPFPFTDLSTTKKRPAVVVSSPAYHQARPDLVILAVTSQAHPSSAFGEAAVAKWKEAGLLRPSVLNRCSRRSSVGWSSAGSAGSRKKIEEHSGVSFERCWLGNAEASY
jgi:mRNA-degrading endonuclease toxin of MazEF toxin-antitoxin module